MWKQEGFRSFYKGITPRVLRVAPGQAIVFAVYERISIMIEKMRPTIREDDGFSEWWVYFNYFGIQLSTNRRYTSIFLWYLLCSFWCTIVHILFRILHCNHVALPKRKTVPPSFESGLGPNLHQLDLWTQWQPSVLSLSFMGKLRPSVIALIHEIMHSIS